MMMLVPNQWRGSVEHFYHFLLGYLMPVAEWAEDNPGCPVTLRDCGSMNRWFEVILADRDVEVIPAGLMLHRLVSQPKDSIVLEPLDDPDHFDGERLAHFAANVRGRLRDLETAAGAGVVVIDRRSADPFLSSLRAENRGSGVQRRSVPNMGSVTRRIRRRHPTERVDLAGLCPAEQVRRLRAARVVVAQHGAGLAGMLWMAAGVGVVEVQPPIEEPNASVFSQLALALGLRHLVVAQEGPHARVDVRAVAAAVDHLSTVP